MGEVKVVVDPGVCKLKTEIVATMDENMDIVYSISSECPNVKKIIGQISNVPVFDVIKTPFVENPIYVICGNLPHAACPVPCAIVKAGEAAGELALGKNVTIEFQ